MNPSELTRHCCLPDGIDSLDNICQTLNIITFPISRDAAVTIAHFSDMWLQLCQAANISAAPLSGFEQPKKLTSLKLTTSKMDTLAYLNSSYLLVIHQYT